jgi:hypothetical protein
VFQVTVWMKKLEQTEAQFFLEFRLQGGKGKK